MHSRSSVRHTGECNCPTSLMISCFLDAGYLMPLCPHPRSYLFTQSIFQCQISVAFIQGPGCKAQTHDLIGGGGTRGIARQAALAGFHELLGASVIKVLGDPFFAAKFRNAVFICKYSFWSHNLKNNNFSIIIAIFFIHTGAPFAYKTTNICLLRALIGDESS